MKRWIKGRVSAFDKLYDTLNQFFVLQTSTQFIIIVLD
ncbi:hypothetical protein Sarmat_01116 [Rickettsiales endosymbiont of Paramecium tredecaurelia]|nr:hypothetical protein [Candidatus Sarmatiella mevalonica]